MISSNSESSLAILCSSRAEWAAERIEEHPGDWRQADLEHGQGQVHQRAGLLQQDRGRQEEWRLREGGVCGPAKTQDAVNLNKNINLPTFDVDEPITDSVLMYVAV